MNQNLKKYLITTIFPYNMIPHKMWDERLQIISLAGFNCIDICFIRNYHENSEDDWNFSESRDVGKLLRLAKKYKLFVIAHTGPYVSLMCNGGGIPPYMLTKIDTNNKSVDSVFLKNANSWYDKIVPIIKKYQSTADGTIIEVKLEIVSSEFSQLNKSILNRLFNKYSLSIPINIEERTPAENELNIYTSYSSLKQQLAKGNKILNAKYYIGGFGFDFENTIAYVNGNGVFLPPAIGENPLISPLGKINKSEFVGMRLFNMFINSYGQNLFNGKNMANNAIKASGGITGGIDIDSYSFENGGILIACTNKTNHAVSIVLTEKNNAFPKFTRLNIPKLDCCYVLKNYSLLSLGIKAVMEYCTAEIIFYNKIGNITYAMIFLDSDGEFCISGENISVLKSDMHYEKANDSKSITVSFSTESEIKLKIGEDKLRITAIDKETVSTINAINEMGIMDCIDICVEEAPRIITTKQVPIYISDTKVNLNYKKIKDSSSIYMEENGIYRGIAIYEAEVVLPNLSYELDEGCISGIVINGASDIVSLYVNENYIITLAPFGTHAFIEQYTREVQLIGDHIMEVPVMKTPQMRASKESSGVNKIKIKSEIWGHSFYNSTMLPSLNTSSMKGIQGISVVISKNEIKPKCMVHPQFAGSFGIYSDTESMLKVKVNGRDIAVIHKNSNYVDITPYVRLKMDNDIEITHISDTVSNSEHNTQHNQVNKHEKYYFVEGIKAQNFKIAEVNEITLINAVNTADEALKTNLPLEIKSGTERFIWFELPKSLFGSKTSYKAVVTGNGIKITAIFNKTITGRIWIADAKENSPDWAFGKSDTIYLPSTLFTDEKNMLVFFIEGVSNNSPCILDSVVFISI